MKKAVTLIELVVAVTIIGGVTLGAFALFNAASDFYRSSDTKSVVLNELTYLLDHIDREVYLATGTPNNPGIDITDHSTDPSNPDEYEVQVTQFDEALYPGLVPSNSVTYFFNATNQDNAGTAPAHTVIFEDTAGNQHTLSRRLIEIEIDPFNPQRGLLEIENIRFCYNPDRDIDERRNPTISAQRQRFGSFMHAVDPN